MVPAPESSSRADGAGAVLVAALVGAVLFGATFAGDADYRAAIQDVVDAPNTYAVFLRGPEHVRVEYVEHKSTFSLT